jgi:uncharacterized protein (DUF2236 family)
MSAVDVPLEHLRRRLQATIRTTLVGDQAPVRDLSQPIRGDKGLFGPDSVTWRVHSDAAMLIGGIRALLMQTLHPRAMAGVADHSAYRTDPTGRLWRTAGYVGTTTFGTTKEAKAAIAMVKRVHTRVVGTTPTGEPYSANDPHLLAYVHATLVDSFLQSYTAYGAKGKLSAAEADQYVAEQARIAVLFQAEAFPTSTAELKQWMAGIRPELRSTPAAREAVRFLLFPPLQPQLLPVYGVLAAAAVSSLPLWARWELRVPKLPLTELLTVRPAAQALSKVIDWAMSAPFAEAH